MRPANDHMPPSVANWIAIVFIFIWAMAIVGIGIAAWVVFLVWR